MRRTAVQIAVLAGILLAVCLICRFTVYDSYKIIHALPSNMSFDEPVLTLTEPGVVHIRSAQVLGGVIKIEVEPAGKGETFIEISDRAEGRAGSVALRVDRFGFIYDKNTGGFTGEMIVLAAITIFFLLISVIMLWSFLTAKGSAFYSYSSVYYAGFFLFSLFTGAVMLRVTILHAVDPLGYSMIGAYSTLNRSSSDFMMITLPLALLFAAALSFSNVVLLKHERAGLKNVLGIIVGILLIAGGLFGAFFVMRDFSGSEWEYRVRSTIENVYSTLFVYFECMLTGAVICGIRAARHIPSYDRDYIIILGCYFRPDGTLPPLLRGRADRAIEFWRIQKEKSGKEALLIPSGGQGKDEPMPEAMAMKRYLLENGIPEEMILPEDQSMNTFENMARSLDIIRSRGPGGKTAFVTTNYHVFRSGVWSNLADLHAEGMGSKTKWWYWPNAFMRECVGLLVKRWKTELLLLVGLMVYYGVLSMTLY